MRRHTAITRGGKRKRLARQESETTECELPPLGGSSFLQLVFSEGSQTTDYNPPPSSQLAQTTDSDPLGPVPDLREDEKVSACWGMVVAQLVLKNLWQILKTESFKNQCMNDSGLAADVLSNYRTGATQRGWCWESPLSPSKDGGYIQISARGFNKFAVLGELLLWTQGLRLRLGSEYGGKEQASHLCHRPRCTVAAHVIGESAENNNRRKNCLVWIACPHLGCLKKILVCPHGPRHCIKYCEGYDSWEDFLAGGIHSAPAIVEINET